MSSILDALKKLEEEKSAKQAEERARQLGPTRPEADLLRTDAESGPDSPVRMSTLLIAAGVVVVFVATLSAVVTVSLLGREAANASTSETFLTPAAQPVQVPAPVKMASSTPAARALPDPPAPTISAIPPAPAPAAAPIPVVPPATAATPEVPPPAPPSKVQPVPETPVQPPAAGASPAPVAPQTPPDEHRENLETTQVAKATDQAPVAATAATPLRETHEEHAVDTAQPEQTVSPSTPTETKIEALPKTPAPAEETPLPVWTPKDEGRTGANAPFKPEKIDVKMLPPLRQSDRAKYGLDTVKVNMLRGVSETRPYGQAIINLDKVMIGEEIPNTRARLIAIDEALGIGIEIVDTRERFFIQL
ncbi:MAG: hypothetical protein HYV26_17400 [Candidatus Hydrogenedentes bacterium]|nr:hypothetical protein [Candidatus Hydrogenedentota bacterium]